MATAKAGFLLNLSAKAAKAVRKNFSHKAKASAKAAQIEAKIIFGLNYFIRNNFSQR
jgi:hypothetical protein